MIEVSEMKKENAYDFRKKLLTVHTPNMRDAAVQIPENTTVLTDGVVVEIGNTDDMVIRTAAEDFVDYLQVSMGLKASLSTAGTACGKNTVRVAIADDTVDMGEAAGYKGFLIQADEGFTVYGYDARGAAQGLFYMEDMMNLDHAPFMEKGEIRKKPMIAPQMIHSGYGMEQWPDEYLMRVAHEGRDAILVFAKDVNLTRVGYLDFNDLIARAAKFGIDVYAYSFMTSDMHPDDPGAEEYYEGTYGKLFRSCPGLKGITMVGEAVEFHSKDPHVSPFRYDDDRGFAMPDGLPWPGWYPCFDVPKFLELVKKIIYKYQPKADIVLWTYNWGYQPVDARVSLVDNLPKDIALESTFEMFETWKVGNSYIAGSDYSIAFEGPGYYFRTEAEAAKRNGLRLYTMSQSGGETWDFGVVPYEPVPYQWMKRFENMRKAHDDWGLCGSMDCHHHGLYPNIISKFSKHAFLTPREDMNVILDRILMGEYGKENLSKVQEGFRLWSEAMTYYTPTEGDLGGAGRVGPAYPFNLLDSIKPPYDKEAMFGAVVVSPRYPSEFAHSCFLSAKPREPILNLRVHEEIKSLEKMLSLWKQGVAVFESIANPNERLQELLNLGKFLETYITTVRNAKAWHVLKCRMHACYEKEPLLAIVDEMEALLRAEIANAEKAIPLAEVDSRLGWEPSMHYLGDAEHIRWKIQQVEYVLDKEFTKLRACINFDGK